MARGTGCPAGWASVRHMPPKHASHLVRLQELGHVSHGARHKLRGDHHEDDL